MCCVHFHSVGTAQDHFQYCLDIIPAIKIIWTDIHHLRTPSNAPAGKTHMGLLRFQLPEYCMYSTKQKNWAVGIPTGEVDGPGAWLHFNRR